MKTVLYSGSASDQGCALQKEYCNAHGIVPVEVLEDKAGSFYAFRRLQTLIKLRACDTVLVQSYPSLAPDKYLRLELDLFIKRNGARLVTLDRSCADPRHGVALAVKRSVSFITELDEQYGVQLPFISPLNEFRRTPPLGYRVAEGSAVIDERGAEAVRRIFSMYADGAAICDICREIDSMLSERKIGNMTVKSVLRNERYLGRASKKSYALEPIIRYDLWLEARERLERDYGPLEERDPLCGFIKADRPFYLYRRPGTKASAIRAVAGYAIDADELNKRLCAAFERISSAEADAFMRYVETERAEAEAALIPASNEYDASVKQLFINLKCLKAGERSTELFDALDSLADSKNVLGMRVRRIRSEAELFSINKEAVDRFFSRASRFDELSDEERGFIASALIRKIRIEDGDVHALIVSPASGRLKRVKLGGVLLNA